MRQKDWWTVCNRENGGSVLEQWGALALDFGLGPQFSVGQNFVTVVN